MAPSILRPRSLSAAITRPRCRRPSRGSGPWPTRCQPERARRRHRADARAGRDRRAAQARGFAHLELMPKEAIAIALAQSAGATLDYTLRPRPAEVSTGTEVLAALIKPQLAPYADRIKRGGAAPAKPAGPARQVSYPSDHYVGPSIPSVIQPAPATSFPPAPPPPPATYTIPVYGDGKMIRQDTVLKPQ